MTADAQTGKTLPRLLAWLVTLLIPVALILTAVRLLITPAFVRLEYNQPGFPPDPFGFTKEERIHWADVAIEYLTNDAGIEYLGDLEFEDGSPLYNERELGHMEDVKIVVQQALIVWYLALLALVILGLWAYFGGWWGDFRVGARRGGWLTLGLIAVVLMLVVVAWTFLFVFFHQVFFEAGTWMFLFSDSLIRLFPERFWQTAFVSAGLFAGLGGLILALVFRKRPAE
jgi:integral membrane protein (TIGR01906 family)